MEFSEKKVLVCGMARSGQAAVRLLSKLGADVTAQDLKEKLPLDFDENIKLILGKNPDDSIKEFDLIIISPGIPFDLPFLEKARSCGIPVWGEVELAYRLCPCPIIAITGTNGKTTVTTLVGEIMKRHNNKTIIVGNIGIPFTELVTALKPDNWVVAEVSSFQLETAHEFSPKISAVLNLTPDHLDRHKTMEIYQATKEKIFARQQPGDLAVLGYDNLLTREMNPPCNTIFFSAKEKLEDGVYLDGKMIRYKDIIVADISKIKILPENALAATALCLCAGVAPETIAGVLLEFRGVEHRIEYVTEINGVEFFNDSKATNTDSAIKGLEAMKRPVILIGGGDGKGASFGDWVRCFDDNGKGKVKHLIVLGMDADRIIETCRAYSYHSYDKVNSLRDAVQLAYSKAEPGDCVLLSPACASLDMFDNYEQRGGLFKDFVVELM